MNTQGWISGIMVYNMQEEKLLYYMLEYIGTEFDTCSKVIKNNDRCIIKLGGHECVIDSGRAAELKERVLMHLTGSGR